MSNKIQGLQAEIVRYYNNMMLVLNGMSRFKTNPDKVILELTAVDATIGATLTTVRSMLNNKSELPRTLEVGITTLYTIAKSYGDKVESTTAELIKEIAYDNSTMVTNHTDLINKVDKELLSNNIAKILANQATREYAANKLPLILDNGISNKFEPKEFLNSLLNTLAKYSHCEDTELISQTAIFSKETIYHDSEIKLVSTTAIDRKEINIPTITSRDITITDDINTYLEPTSNGDEVLTSLESLVTVITNMTDASIDCINSTKTILQTIEDIDVGYIRIIKDKLISLGSAYANSTITEQEYNITLNNVDYIVKKQLSSYTKLVDMVDDELTETNVNLDILDKAYGVVISLLVNIAVG